MSLQKKNTGLQKKNTGLENLRTTKYDEARMKSTPLHALHASLGARFTELADWQVPADYADARAEHMAVRQQTGILDLSYRGRVRLSGPERGKFLQGLITNDVLKLTEGGGLYAAILNPKGRMLADLKLYCIQEAFLLDLDREITDKTVQILNRYRLVSKVQLEDLSDQLAQLAVHGPGAAPLVEKVLGVSPPPIPELSSITVQWQGHTVYLIRSGYTGEEGFDLILPVEGAEPLWKRLCQAKDPLTIRPVGLEALKSLRVEAGIPQYGLDMDENTFPPEAGLEEKAISYTKGCYVGQETIARIKSYGQVHRRLAGLIFEEGLSAGEFPQPKDKVLKEGQEIGFVTTTVNSPLLKRPIALAYIQRKAFEPDLPVTVGKCTARTTELPFYKRNPS